MKRRNLLILFSKWPEEKDAKSRISKIIGDDLTREFCFSCLDDLITKLKKLSNIQEVIVTNTIKESKLFTKRYNLNSTSLEEMNIELSSSKSQIFEEIFDYFLKDYNKVILIPMDIPHIKENILKEAFNVLNKYDQIFGPETNGGVYLMGLKKDPHKTFNNVRWSTEHSFNDLMENCENVASLELFFDINELKDILYLNKKDLLS